MISTGTGLIIRSDLALSLVVVRRASSLFGPRIDYVAVEVWLVEDDLANSKTNSIT